MNLHYKELGQGKPLVILHGLFGSLDNWQTHAKKLSEYFRVILVDQRNHGHSDWSEEFNYSLLAQDLKELVDQLNLTDFYLLGHSMGGKTVMQFVQNYPDLVEKLIVLDIGIKQYPMHHEEILKGIHAVSASPMDSRSAAESILLPYVPDFGTRQFLLKNLYWKEKGKLAWRMNVEVLEREMQYILAALPTDENFTPTLFIRGERSGYILEEDYSDIEIVFPDSTFETIENAGHWVHAEAPDEFINAVLAFLLR